MARDGTAVFAARPSYYARGRTSHLVGRSNLPRLDQEVGRLFNVTTRSAAGPTSLVCLPVPTPSGVG
jgi:hypothetical protein